MDMRGHSWLAGIGVSVPRLSVSTQKSTVGTTRLAAAEIYCRNGLPERLTARNGSRGNLLSERLTGTAHRKNGSRVTAERLTGTGRWNQRKWVFISTT